MGLKECYVEGKQKVYPLPEEDVKLFDCFAQFIYRDDWKFEDEAGKSPQHHVLIRLVRLYGLGDRLMSPSFKAAAVQKFLSIPMVVNTFDGSKASLDLTSRRKRCDGLPSNCLCDLLEIVANELPHLILTEDPMKEFVVACAIVELDTLQRITRFENLLRTHGDLAVAIAMKAAGRQLALSPE